MEDDFYAEILKKIELNQENSTNNYKIVKTKTTNQVKIDFSESNILSLIRYEKTSKIS